MSMLLRSKGSLYSTSFTLERLDAGLDLHSRHDCKTHKPKWERSIWIASWVLSGSKLCPVCAAGEPSWRRQLCLSNQQRSYCNTIIRLTTPHTVLSQYLVHGKGRCWVLQSGRALSCKSAQNWGLPPVCLLEYHLCNLQQALALASVLHHTQQVSNRSNCKPFSCHQLCTIDTWRLKEKTCFKVILFKFHFHFISVDFFHQMV